MATPNHLEVRLTFKPILDGLTAFANALQTQLQGLKATVDAVNASLQAQVKEAETVAATSTTAMEQASQATETTDDATKQLNETLGRLNEHLDTIAAKAPGISRIDTAARQAAGGLGRLAGFFRARIQDVREFNRQISNGDVAIRKWAAGLAALVSASALRQFAADAGEADKVQQQLNRTLQRAGQTGAAAALRAQAEALEEVTYFSAQQVRHVQRLLVAYGLTGDQALAMAETVLDFAQETGRGAEEAAAFVGRTLADDREELTRYGLKLDTTKGKVDALTGAMRNFAAGAARAAVADPTQRSTQVRRDRATEDIGRTLNRILYPAFEAFLPLIESTAKWLTAFGQQLAPIAPVLGDIAAQLVPLVAGWALLAGAHKGVMAGLNPLRSAIRLLAGQAFGELSTSLGRITTRFGLARAAAALLKDGSPPWPGPAGSLRSASPSPALPSPAGTSASSSTKSKSAA